MDAIATWGISWNWLSPLLTSLGGGGTCIPCEKSGVELDGCNVCDSLKLPIGIESGTKVGRLEADGDIGIVDAFILGGRLLTLLIPGGAT